MKTNLYICALLVALGIASHGAKKLYDLEQAGTILSPHAYARKHPYAVVLAIISTYLLAATFYFMGQLNEITAILTGISCGSAFDTLRARAVKQLRDSSDNESGV